MKRVEQEALMSDVVSASCAFGSLSIAGICDQGRKPRKESMGARR
jgi:hypothetical protein